MVRNNVIRRQKTGLSPASAGLDGIAMEEASYHQVSGSPEPDSDIERMEFPETPDLTLGLTTTESSGYPIQQQGINRADSLSTDSENTAPYPRTNTTDSLAADKTAFRADGFADKQTLAGYFPRISDANEKTSLRIRLSKRNQALLLQVALIGTIFATNLSILVYASSKYPARDGVGLLYAGDCDTVKSANRWLHLLINVLSTGMISASSFCIQLQASPTRADVDKMHGLNKWLDIGAPSLRNLRYIGQWRLACCIVLAFSSLPIHLIFNSAVFQALASNDYSVAVVDESFISGASWDLSTAIRNRGGDPGWDDVHTNPPNVTYESLVDGMQKDVMKGLYEMKNVSECYALYEDYWAIQQGNVVVVAKNGPNTSNKNDSLLLYTFVTPRYDNYAKNLWAAENGTAIYIAFSPSPPPHNDGIPRPTALRGVLLPSSVSVCTLNFLKLLALFSVWLSRKRAESRRKTRSEEWGVVVDTEEHVLARREAVLSTLGDAIQSFMQEPDEATKNMCLATKYDFLQKGTLFKRWRKEKSEPPVHPRKWEMSQRRWMSAATLLFSIMYTVCGAIMTTCLVQREFSLMYTRAHRKPLRVSEPVGIQRSSYFISLPLRYGVPLNLFSAVFHWLVSQSYFLARITALLPTGDEDYANSFSTLGYSPYAIIVTGIVAFIQITTVILLGCRKYDGTMSMVSTNSMAISAACHALAEDREFGHELPIQWGVVEIGEDGIGHCAFTTAPHHVIRKAEEGVLYQ
ncbi:hypothetical protein O1611_g1943 [Lasiodiplodia mahajangana]|uniref:Uncharacterized protein n=1 Tax=Lasiodiplodia mahajangana TaxID=1108764 RepID=A0ACC2JWN2_9PEZI|nr:hypothetical protein O1611_g1943 [Lasiodiplodia mahajangana]